MATLGYTADNTLVSAILNSDRAGYVSARFIRFDSQGQVIDKRDKSLSLTALLRIPIRKRKGSRNPQSASDILGALV